MINLRLRRLWSAFQTKPFRTGQALELLDLDLVTWTDWATTAPFDLRHRLEADRGLYRICPLPPVPPEVRHAAAALLATMGQNKVHLSDVAPSVGRQELVIAALNWLTENRLVRTQITGADAALLLQRSDVT